MELLIRPLKKDDLDELVIIDTEITGKKRESYYRRKFVEIFDSGRLSVSLVAEVDDRVVGFLLGQVYEGEYGIPENTAYLDTIGILPKYSKVGVGTRLLEQFVANMRACNVSKIYTLVNFSDTKLIKFFGSHGFSPSKRINLELEVL
ncbi:MAG: hypothetical protein OHK0040_11060 [bacterium]